MLFEFLLILSLKVCDGLQVVSSHREVIIGDSRKLLPSIGKTIGEGYVQVFTAKEENEWFCGILPTDFDEEVDLVKYAVHIEEGLVKRIDEAPYLLPLAVCCATLAKKFPDRSAVVLGTGVSAQYTKALLEALGFCGVDTLSPKEAEDYQAKSADQIFIDLAGSESLRHQQYISLISHQAREAIDQGVFAKSAEITVKFPVDASQIATILNQQQILSTLSSINTKQQQKNMVAGFFLRNLPGRAADEYSDFFQWPRDADNRGRRLGFELLYELSDSPFLISKLAADASVPHSDIVHHPNNHREFFDDPQFPSFISSHSSSSTMKKKKKIEGRIDAD